MNIPKSNKELIEILVKQDAEITKMRNAIKQLDRKLTLTGKVIDKVSSVTKRERLRTNDIIQKMSNIVTYLKAGGFRG